MGVREQLMMTPGAPWEFPLWAVNTEATIVLNKNVMNSLGYYLFTACPGRLPPDISTEMQAR